MTRAALSLLALLAGASAASAQARPYVPSMFCAQANALVRSRGAIVLSTGPTTYDRFVSEDIRCEPDAYAAPAFEPTRDNRSCMIGYYCKQKEENER